VNVPGLFHNIEAEHLVNVVMSKVSDQLPDEVDRHYGELVAFRRHLHAEPELSGEEEETTLTLLERLTLAGLAPHRLAIGTGLVCDVGDPAGPLVGVRGDIDALAMHDAKRVSYASRKPGVAHACGHDVHAAIVLGVALVLRRLLPLSGLSGGVRLIFEPREEIVPGGAVHVISEGWLDPVSAIYGLHCDPKLDLGYLGCRDGAFTSASDQVDIRLSGPGGHTARPHLTVDLIRALSRTALELPEELQRQAASLGPVSLVFGSVASGDAPNVIPAAGVLRGTLRTPSRDVWAAAPELVEKSLAAVAADVGADWEVDHTRGVPPTINHVAGNRVMAAAGRAVLGEDGVVETDHSLGGDSFAWYLERIPGAYARIGTHNRAAGGRRHDLHASTFDVDERSIALGVQVLTIAALAELIRLAG
jgi:amidohydrolase